MANSIPTINYGPFEAIKLPSLGQNYFGSQRWEEGEKLYRGKHLLAKTVKETQTPGSDISVISAVCIASITRSKKYKIDLQVIEYNYEFIFLITNN